MKKNKTRKPARAAAPVEQKEASYGEYYRPRVITVPFDAEKNFGELGLIKNYQVQHDLIRQRSQQLFLESDLCQLTMRRFTSWVCGDGLQLNANPSVDVLKTEKIKLKPEDFNKNIEARWRVYAKSKQADYSSMRSLHKLASRCFRESIVGGDTLVVLRYIKATNRVTVQLIDGAFVGTPPNLLFSGGDHRYSNGNRVRWGVEIDATGQHIAYHVRQGSSMEYVRIEAKPNPDAPVSAFLVYGLEYRLDNIRGIPLLTAVMETAKKLDRYKEATIGSAEERQKVAYTLQHNVNGSGANPMANSVMSAAGGKPAGEMTKTADGRDVASKFIATFNKSMINLPPGAEAKQLVSDNELVFKDFFEVNIGLVCATIEMPMNVAMMQYNDSYSASRAALKDWEHKLIVQRSDFSEQFHQRIYDFWLLIQVLTNKVSAPGYLEAIDNGNTTAISAYNNANWTGAPVPHINPVDEVKAARMRLGKMFDNVPLSTLEEETRNLNAGDSWANMRQVSKELDEAKKNKIYLFPLNMAKGATAPAGSEEYYTEPK